MAKKETKKAAPKKAAPTKAAPTKKATPRKKAAAKSSDIDKLEERKNLQNFKNSAEGRKAISDIRDNKAAMIEKNVFFRERNKTR